MYRAIVTDVYLLPRNKLVMYNISYPCNNIKIKNIKLSNKNKLEACVNTELVSPIPQLWVVSANEWMDGTRGGGGGEVEKGATRP